jgi:hypothetical protein
MKMEFTIENLILDISSYLQINYNLNNIPDEISDDIIEHAISLIDKQLDKRRSEKTRQNFKRKLLSNINNQLMSFESSANGINFNVKETTTLISEEIIEYLDELENANIVPIDKLNVLNAQQLAFMFSALPTLSKMKLSNTQLSKIINSLFGNASNNIRKRLSEPNNLKKEEYNKVIEFMNDWIKRIVDREGQLKEEKLS